ncbi:oligopeptide/dipeptide ABC transporter ATP-binding protein [Halorarum halobium]|uniref:oligopeptide/dipeptide ABC transporter ATP-binding protein n=1 Tax=Halorarum halobium TaxID=3075121 RepID=UPI0028AA70AF|nr:oligopeptide/dipeptide ABC transporter ATP-binding protein [Halobaculum sp. XH14]
MSDPLLSVEGLEKHYPVSSGLFDRTTGHVRAVDGIDFAVREGEVFGLLGESGCGKSTAARNVLRLEEPTAGTVRFDGADLTAFDDEELRAFRRRAQLVLQNPADSFDPRMTVRQSVAEPLQLHGVRDADVRESVVFDLLDRVGLSADVATRYPRELSGGQKQRAAIARALVLNPDLLVADEPVSALDVSIQAQVLDLLSSLRAELGLSVLLISHDMNVVREVCDRVGVMYAGKLVEVGPTEELFADPAHPYTRALTEAVPTIGGDVGARSGLAGEVPDPADPPDGCRFHPRCPSLIPPDDVALDPARYRRLMRLYVDVREGAVDREGLAERAGADVPTDDLPALVRDAYGLSGIGNGSAPADGPASTAEPALVEAAVGIVRGEREAGVPAAAEPLRSPCMERVPDHVAPGAAPPDSAFPGAAVDGGEETAERRVACHLHREAVASPAEVAPR